jgi:serine/threonine-protein kinase HipA
MKKKKKKNVLKLYMNDLHIGRLEEHPSGALTLQYELSYVQNENAIPISRSLSLQEEQYVGAVVQNYFDNLLPDSAQIRQLLAQRTAADSTGVFDILWNIGRDCAGAIQFIPEEITPEPSHPMSSAEISDTAIATRLKQLKQFPLGIQSNDDFRISIAGAQEKTAFLRQMENGTFLTAQLRQLTFSKPQWASSMTM